MYSVDEFVDYYIIEYKVRKESDFWLVYFHDLGNYYATNEIGKDILQYFTEVSQKTLFQYLVDLYGELNDNQLQEIEQFLFKLKDNSILKRRHSNEKI